MVQRNTDCRFVERPYNQDSATTYGVEIAGRYALKQTEIGAFIYVECSAFNRTCKN